MSGPKWKAPNIYETPCFQGHSRSAPSCGLLVRYPTTDELPCQCCPIGLFLSVNVIFKFHSVRVFRQERPRLLYFCCTRRPVQKLERPASFSLLFACLDKITVPERPTF